MQESTDARLARTEQVLLDMRSDIDELRSQRREDHHRLRAVEAATEKLLEVQRDARRHEEAQYRALGLRVQWLSAAIAFGGLAMAIAVTLLGR